MWQHGGVGIGCVCVWVWVWVWIVTSGYFHRWVVLSTLDELSRIQKGRHICQGDLYLVDVAHRSLVTPLTIMPFYGLIASFVQIHPDTHDLSCLRIPFCLAELKV
jgi:hypothetical protein